MTRFDFHVKTPANVRKLQAELGDKGTIQVARNGNGKEGDKFTYAEACATLTKHEALRIAEACDASLYSGGKSLRYTSIL